MKFSIISAYPPREGSKPSVIGSAEILITDADLLRSEDYNADTGKSYLQAELYSVTTAKIRCTVIRTQKGGAMIVGAVVPPYDEGVRIAEAIVARLESRQAETEGA